MPRGKKRRYGSRTAARSAKPRFTPSLPATARETARGLPGYARSGGRLGTGQNQRDTSSSRPAPIGRNAHRSPAPRAGGTDEHIATRTHRSRRSSPRSGLCAPRVRPLHQPRRCRTSRQLPLGPDRQRCGWPSAPRRSIRNRNKRSPGQSAVQVSWIAGSVPWRGSVAT